MIAAIVNAQVEAAAKAKIRLVKLSRPLMTPNHTLRVLSGSVNPSKANDKVAMFGSLITCIKEAKEKRKDHGNMFTTNRATENICKSN
jgi:hypothetical protein